MPSANDSCLSETFTAHDGSAQNLAEALLNNRFFCWLFPVVAYILAVLLQTGLNDLVRMEYGATILYLSFGVRLFVALLFGFEGLVWMVLGQIFIFTFYPTPYYKDHPLESFLLSCSYSIIAYMTVQLIRRMRQLDTNFSQVTSVDIMLITGLGSLIAALMHGVVLGNLFVDPLASIMTSFIGKFVGSMIGFYGLMLLFSLLHRIKLKP